MALSTDYCLLPGEALWRIVYLQGNNEMDAKNLANKEYAIDLIRSGVNYLKNKPEVSTYASDHDARYLPSGEKIYLFNCGNGTVAYAQYSAETSIVTFWKGV